MHFGDVSTRPEIHRPREIMKPRDKATSDPDTSHYAQRTAGKMTGASLVSSHPPRLKRAHASFEALTEEIVLVNKSSTMFFFFFFFFFFTLLYIIDVTRKKNPLKWHHIKISGNCSVASLIRYKTSCHDILVEISPNSLYHSRINSYVSFSSISTLKKNYR